MPVELHLYICLPLFIRIFVWMPEPLSPHGFLQLGLPYFACQLPELQHLFLAQHLELVFSALELLINQFWGEEELPAGQWPALWCLQPSLHVV